MTSTLQQTAFILVVDVCLFVCCEQAAKEKETLRRSYFLFIAAVVTNDVTVVLTSQSEFQFLAGNNSLQVTCNRAVNLVSFLCIILYAIFVLLL